MNEYGAKETWTKQLSIGPLLAWSFVGCGRNEERTSLCNFLNNVPL